MANIRVDSKSTVHNGQTITFKSPADCSQVTGLRVYYPNEGEQAFKEFQFADAHGNNVGYIDLFAADVLVKVILDTELNRAYVQNADTNAYLEGRFDEKADNSHEHTPDDTYAIGDIRNTILPTLGDRWLKCDGSSVYVDEYPEICADDMPLLTAVTQPDTAYGNYGYDSKSIAYNDGKYLLNRSHTGKGGLVYCEDISKNNWSEVTVESSVDHTIYGVKYYKGYWFAFGTSASYTSGNSTYSVATIWYSTNPTKNGWSKKYFKVASTTTLYDIAFHDGYLVGVGFKYNSNSSNNPVIVYLDSSGDGTLMTLTDYSNAKLTSVTYCNGTWVAAGNTQSWFGRDPNGSTYLVIYTATDPTSSSKWTKNASVSGVTLGNCFDICSYGNTCAIVGGWYDENYSSSNTSWCYRARILYTTSPTGSWTSKNLWIDNGGGGGCITHDGTDWIVLYMCQRSSDKRLQTRLAKFSSLSSEPHFNEYVQAFTELTYSESATPLCIYADSDIWFVHIQYNENAGYSKVIHSKRKALPTITLDNAYTYIKAK